MTFNQKLKEYLVNNGMFESDADTILEGFRSDKVVESMGHRWNDKISDYPDVMLATLLVSLKRFTYEWLEANKPMHWAKPMFAPSES